MKLGFIGVGHMAQAIILGLLKAEVIAPADILVHGGHLANYQKFAENNGLGIMADNQAVVASADVIVLAVKPQQKAAVLSDLVDLFQEKNKSLFSLLSGVSLADLAAIVGEQVPIVRVMPNLNVQIKQGITALAANQSAQVAALPTAQKLFGAIGSTLPLAEKDFSTFVALAGSAPAFVYLFIDALAHAGVKYGLTKKQAVAIVSQMVAGSAQLVQGNDQSPWDLADAVASPGGTTIAGLLALQEAGFEPAITKAVDATIAKDSE